MNVDPPIRQFGYYRTRRVQEIALEGEPDGISGALLLAIGLRESGLRNINNQAQTDHGCFQISERYHAAWLNSVPGCPETSWHPHYEHKAIEDGFCPTCTDGARYAVRLLRQAVEFASDHEVAEADRVRFAVAAYNAGAGGALAGYRAGDVDSRTTGGDYSAWVLLRRVEVNRWLGKNPKWRVAG